LAPWRRYLIVEYTSNMYFSRFNYRINKRGSQKDMEQKKNGNYFFYDDGANEEEEGDDDFDDI
jgi:hypothetical protein